MKKLTATLLVGFVFGVSQIAQAQTRVEKGKTIAIEIPFDTEALCNMEVVRGGEKTNVRVERNKKSVYQFDGRELGEETIRWEGKMKFRGLKTLGPCRGNGEITVTTVNAGSEFPEAPIDRESARSDTTKTAVTAPSSQLASTQPEALPASEDFLVLYNTSELDYLRLLKKLDGSTKIANADQAYVGGFCLYTTGSYDQATRAALNGAMPELLAEEFKKKGSKADNRFSHINCTNAAGIENVGNAELLVIQRPGLAQVSSLPGFKSLRPGGLWLPFATINGDAVATTLTRLADAERTALATADSRRDELERLANARSKDKIGSITIAYSQRDENLRLCTRKGDETFELATKGYFSTEALRLSEGYISNANKERSLLNRDSPITKVYESLDDFYEAIQRNEVGQRGRACEVYVDYPENLKVLMGVFKAYELNPLVPVLELKEDWARQQGYADFGSYEFAKTVGGDAGLVAELASRDVTEIKTFNEAVAQMINQGYSQDRSAGTVLSFLIDQRIGFMRNMSAVAVRDEKRRAEAAEAKKRKDIQLQKYPYFAILSCGGRGEEKTVLCFNSQGFEENGVHTELKLTRGGISEIYSAFDFGHFVGRWERDGLHIDLPSSFRLTAQNASKMFALQLKVYDSETGNLVYQDVAGQFAYVDYYN